MVEHTKAARRTISRATTHAKNAAHVARGRVKVVAGKRTGNRRLQAEGRIEELRGRAKQIGQRVKESLEN